MLRRLKRRCEGEGREGGEGEANDLFTNTLLTLPVNPANHAPSRHVHVFTWCLIPSFPSLLSLNVVFFPFRQCPLLSFS